MYQIEHFSQTDRFVLQSYMAKHPFAALVVSQDDQVSVNHLPLEFDPTSGPMGILRGHIARGNPLWREHHSGGRALAIFSAHQAYVSPDWYPSKATDPRVVPTWNYVAIHVSGSLRFFHEPDRIQTVLTGLTERFEKDRPRPWHVHDAPEDFLDKMIQAVVGFEIEVDEFVGKWKLSQNRSEADRQGVAQGLREEGGESGAALAELMESSKSA